MSKLLYDSFIKDNPKDKEILDKCLKYVNRYGKELYELTFDECIGLIKFFNNDTRVKEVCEKYVYKAMEDYYTDDSLNKFTIL